MDVLIAHGSEASRRRLASTLVGHDVELVEAGQGAVALDVLMAARGPRLALVDWDLPGCDGPELCRLVRAWRGAGPPYIILLARGDHHLAEGLEAGADDCVHTPADADQLRARINVGRRFAALPWERVTAAATAARSAHPSAMPVPHPSSMRAPRPSSTRSARRTTMVIAAPCPEGGLNWSPCSSLSDD
jgi:DNA-binding response OmpR family regulator